MNGLGDAIGEALIAGLIFVVVVALIVGAALGRFIPWLWHHIDVRWLS